MKKGIKAFFYDNRYYLMPEGCSGVEDVKFLKMSEVKRLKEENCLAPDFICDELQSELLIIEDRRRIFPARINLYSAEEYAEKFENQRLKNCCGCFYDCFASGNAREKMGAFGNCLFRRGREFAVPASLAERLGRAAEQFTERRERFAGYIDAGELDKLGESVNELLSDFLLDGEVYGCKRKEGGYFVCFSAGNFRIGGLRVILKAFTDAVNNALKCLQKDGEERAEWKIYPYYPKGIYAPELTPDYFAKPPRLFVSQDRNGGAGILVFDEDCGKWDEDTLSERRKAVYRYLCSAVGEDLLLAEAETIRFSSVKPQECMEVTTGQLFTMLMNKEKTRAGELVFPPYRGYTAPRNDMNFLPFKEGTLAWATICKEFSLENVLTPCVKGEADALETDDFFSRDDEECENHIPENDGENDVAAHWKGREILNYLGAEYYYLWLPQSFLKPREEKNEDVLDEYLRLAKREEKTDGGHTSCMELIGTTVTLYGVCKDFMVFDERRFFRLMTKIAPVLIGLDVKIVAVKAGGAIVYEPKRTEDGYVFKNKNEGILN